MSEERKKLTVPDLRVRKKAGEKVVMVSVPDYLSVPKTHPRAEW